MREHIGSSSLKFERDVQQEQSEDVFFRDYQNCYENAYEDDKVEQPAAPAVVLLIVYQTDSSGLRCSVLQCFLQHTVLSKVARRGAYDPGGWSKYASAKF